MIRTVLKSFRKAVKPESLPANAASERDRDRRGVPAEDPGNERLLPELIAWLGRAQENSRPKDDGVARDFSLIHGWSSSYPETTGYIIPTMIEYARRSGDTEARDQARRMLNWLVSIQFPEGGFQGSVIGARVLTPVTFNTGQILMGLTSGTLEFGDEYRDAMKKAADWLVDTQDPDGCWRRHRTPYAEPTDKAYETHVAWGLLEAARLELDSQYANAALANVRWALGLQKANGWFSDCCLSDPNRPLTHTIGYALRGVVEAFKFTNDQEFLDGAVRTADALLKAVRKDGSLPGRLNRNWQPRADWTCLTGNVQIAACWFYLYDHTGNRRYLDAARAANAYVRRTVALTGSDDVRGAVKGSFPIWGDYCSYEYPNWATKFLADSIMLEQDRVNED